MGGQERKAGNMRCKKNKNMERKEEIQLGGEKSETRKRELTSKEKSRGGRER